MLRGLLSANLCSARVVDTLREKYLFREDVLGVYKCVRVNENNRCDYISDKGDKDRNSRVYGLYEAILHGDLEKTSGHDQTLFTTSKRERDKQTSICVCEWVAAIHYRLRVHHGHHLGRFLVKHECLHATAGGREEAGDIILERGHEIHHSSALPLSTRQSKCFNWSKALCFLPQLFLPQTICRKGGGKEIRNCGWQLGMDALNYPSSHIVCSIPLFLTRDLLSPSLRFTLCCLLLRLLLVAFPPSVSTFACTFKKAPQCKDEMNGASAGGNGFAAKPATIPFDPNHGRSLEVPSSMSFAVPSPPQPAASAPMLPQQLSTASNVEYPDDFESDEPSADTGASSLVSSLRNEQLSTAGVQLPAPDPAPPQSSTAPVAGALESSKGGVTAARPTPQPQTLPQPQVQQLLQPQPHPFNAPTPSAVTHSAHGHASDSSTAISASSPQRQQQMQLQLQLHMQTQHQDQTPAPPPQLVSQQPFAQPWRTEAELARQVDIEFREMQHG